MCCMSRRRFLIVSLIVLVASSTPSLAAVSFDVPRVDKISIDGDDADWGERGLRVEFLTSTTGRLFAAKDFSARAKIGWDDGGLLVFARVLDDVRDENPKDEPLGRNDSLEVFLSDGVGSPQSYQFTIAAGAPGAGKPRSAVTDRRATKTPPEKIQPEMAAKAFDGGYAIEMRLPWPESNPPRKLGDSVGFQLRVNDTDKGPRKALLWYPKPDTYTNPDSMHRLVLAEKPSPPVRLAAQGDYDAGLSRADVTVTALPELSGKVVEVREDERSLARDTLGPVGEDGVAVARPRLPIPPRDHTYGPLAIVVDGRPAATLQLPDADDVRARRLITLPVVFQPGNVLTTAEFPRPDFEQPLAAQQILGPYAIRTAFYDAGYQIVTQAAKPGRYGAVIEFIPDAGGAQQRTIRRFRTIYRSGSSVPVWRAKTSFAFDDPREVESDPATVAAADEMLGDFASDLIDRATNRDDALPAILASLAATSQPAGATRWRRNNDGFAQDRQWWVGLKRKLNGWDKKCPDAFVSPRPINGPPATVLHAGSAQEAGFTDAGLAKLEKVCTDWARDGGEGFDVCIARHGVIAFNKPFGQRRGKPMTLDEKSRLASVTKIFSGTAMMMLVDQRLVALDDPVGKYLPAFAPTPPGKTVLTIRHLYTHTAGLWDIWSADERSPDYDELIGEYAPRLLVGRKYAYQSSSQGVGGKILEAVTGEALPAFFLNHLLQPLAMDHTDVASSGSGAYSTSLDLAKFGQMLLSGGAYGSMRFMKSETLDAMMSRPLTDVLGPGTTIKYGIGISAYDDSVFGPRTFGHGSASSTIFRVCPDKDMVVMAARNAEGQRYYEYEAKFFQAIADALMKE
jgi:CubicO group peptidase (beta-lactamase class C family)